MTKTVALFEDEDDKHLVGAIAFEILAFAFPLGRVDEESLRISVASLAACRAKVKG